MRVENSIQDQLTGIGYGFTAPAVRDAVAAELQDVVKNALNSPRTRMTVESAVDQHLSGFGLGITSPAVGRAVAAELQESSRTPSTRRGRG